VRVIIAEDDAVSRKILETLLRKWGHEITTTRDGEAAWNVLREPGAPSLAILDILMPGIDGLELCRRVRQSPNTIPPYIILLTANHGVREIVKGIDAGANDYLTKPYDSDELRARVQVGVRMVELQTSLAERVKELEVALAHVKQLEGILPICSYCKKIRNDLDSWQHVESYVAAHSQAEFSHSICPACFENTVKPQLESFQISRASALEPVD
jgi:phosphoserine phosphatase RsbU/P